MSENNDNGHPLSYYVDKMDPSERDEFINRLELLSGSMQYSHYMFNALTNVIQKDLDSIGNPPKFNARIKEYKHEVSESIDHLTAAIDDEQSKVIPCPDTIKGLIIIRSTLRNTLIWLKTTCQPRIYLSVPMRIAILFFNRNGDLYGEYIKEHYPHLNEQRNCQSTINKIRYVYNHPKDEAKKLKDWKRIIYQYLTPEGQKYFDKCFARIK